MTRNLVASTFGWTPRRTVRTHVSHPFCSGFLDVTCCMHAESDQLVASSSVHSARTCLILLAWLASNCHGSRQLLSALRPLGSRPSLTWSLARIEGGLKGVKQVLELLISARSDDADAGGLNRTLPNHRLRSAWPNHWLQTSTMGEGCFSRALRRRPGCASRRRWSGSSVATSTQRTSARWPFAPSTCSAG